MISTQPCAPATAMAGLYKSLMSSQRHARRTLQSMQDIERRHRHTALADLVDLAATGALDRPAPDETSH